MPEGHTIHRLAKLHNTLLVDHRLTVTSPQGRFADGAKRVTGRTLKGVQPHGKHLFYGFFNDLAVHVHLGMHGAFRTLPVPAKGEPMPEARGAVRVRFVGGAKIVDLNGPTVCEVLDANGVAAVRDRLGPDVLDPDADAERVWDALHKRRAPIGGLLMDQSIVSGIGNIYRAEVLYRQGIHPLLPGSSLTREQFNQIWRDSLKLLKFGFRHGHIVTVDAADIAVPLAKATGDDRFLIYRRPTCRRCGAKVMRFTLAGRDCFLCSKEQKLPRGVDVEKFDFEPVLARKPRARGRDHGDAEEE
jgi:formamidopyrimidine-DNA glycosylase